MLLDRGQSRWRRQQGDRDMTNLQALHWDPDALGLAAHFKSGCFELMVCIPAVNFME